MGPMGQVTRDEAVEAYREQAEGLHEGGVDLFFLETMPSLDQAEAALEAVRGVTSETPVMVSLTFSEEGRTLYGGDAPEDVVRRLEEQLSVPSEQVWPTTVIAPMIFASCRALTTLPRASFAASFRR